jgi:ABC-type lipoprotein release transport system permease subunit
VVIALAVGTVLGLAPAVLAIAVGVAVLPALLAGRTRPAAVLRDE